MTQFDFSIDWNRYDRARRPFELRFAHICLSISRSASLDEYDVTRARAELFEAFEGVVSTLSHTERLVLTRIAVEFCIQIDLCVIQCIDHRESYLKAKSFLLADLRVLFEIGVWPLMTAAGTLLSIARTLAEIDDDDLKQEIIGIVHSARHHLRIDPVYWAEDAVQWPDDVEKTSVAWTDSERAFVSAIRRAMES